MSTKGRLKRKYVGLPAQSPSQVTPSLVYTDWWWGQFYYTKNMEKMFKKISKKY